MRRGERFTADQAEIAFNDVFVEYLEECLTPEEQISVLKEVVRLCDSPWGTHPLSNRGGDDQLAGWNTVDVLQKQQRVIFASREVDGVGFIEVLCAGPRKDGGAYDIAATLARTGRLTPDEVTQIWEALALLDVVEEDVGLDGWDYRPPPAPEGMIRTAVASGVLDDETARILSQDELHAAMLNAWGDDGTPDPGAALRAAMARARNGVDAGDVTRILQDRRTDRCDAVMPRAGARCIRQAEHPGAHRATP